ncbi:MAG TPA: acetolactate synthase [Actinomycetota bacterium]|nr:acetolactate synthase [Actinomycetota bacterium]
MARGHGGDAAAAALRALGVPHVFSLSGGHVFPIFDGCHRAGIRVIDVRHEQTAGFAAEGWARLTRSPGVAVVTAGPGVTNVVSPLAQARFNRAPVVVLAGRAPGFRWGQGSLQEIDHVPFVDPIAPAATVGAAADVARRIVAAATDAATPPRGPVFLDFPLEVLFDDAELDAPEPAPPAAAAPDAGAVDAVARVLAGARRPVVVAGSNVWLDRAEHALRAFARAARAPVFTNGQGRGCIPADDELAFARSRSRALRAADVVVVAGTPLDFRLGFGASFAPGAAIVHLDSHESLLARHVDCEAALAAPLDAALGALAAAVERPCDSKEWLAELRATEDAKRAEAAAEACSDAAPIHPLRVFAELVPLLERDAVVVGDGGDFVSYAGREIPSYEPGCWLDPGPFGCLGCGFGYALAARLAHPGRQVVLLLGDGAFGFAGMELETLVRHGLPVVCVVGNNGIWGLEKHPMRALYGYDVAADLRPGIRYDEVAEAFGGRGELVTDPAELRGALERALAAGEPALVNVVTDPSVAYPRSANLA